MSGVLVAGLLTGCGVRTTGVVDAGIPAGGVASGGTVYLLGASGELQEVPRMGLSGGDVQTAVGSLLAGLDEVEREKGYRTALPDGVTLVALQSNEKGVAITVSADPSGFSELALTQVSCTVTAFPAAKLAEAPLVVLDGPGGDQVVAPDCPLI